MTRKEANLQILGRLIQYALDAPDQRFGQILRNSGMIVDFQDPPGEGEPKWFNHFNEESESILKRMEEAAKQRKLT
jgi:hypothetical protein